jgi:hypothetical protein
MQETLQTVYCYNSLADGYSLLSAPRATRGSSGLRACGLQSYSLPKTNKRKRNSDFRKQDIPRVAKMMKMKSCQQGRFRPRNRSAGNAAGDARQNDRRDQLRGAVLAYPQYTLVRKTGTIALSVKSSRNLPPFDPYVPPVLRPPASGLASVHELGCELVPCALFMHGSIFHVRRSQLVVGASKSFLQVRLSLLCSSAALILGR